MDVIIEQKLFSVNNVEKFIRNNNMKDIKFIASKKDKNLDLLKLIALRLVHYDDLYQFIQLNSTILYSIDSFFWKQLINIDGGTSEFYEYLINKDNLSYDFLIYIDEMIQIDFDNEVFNLKYDRYDDYEDDEYNEDDEEFKKSYFLLRWYRLPEGQKLVKYFLTHLKRQLTYAEMEFILETVDVELFEAAKNSLLDTSIMPNDKLVFMFICYWDPNGFVKYQKDIDKVIECLNWVFNNNYNIILDAEILQDDYLGPGDLDIRILKWFKAHDIIIENLKSNDFINRSKDVITWIVKNLDPITSYKDIYQSKPFSLTFEELDELIQAKILPLPTLEEIDDIDTMMNIRNIAEIFKQIKDKYYPLK